jgi:WD repeat-containing protein 45
MLAVTSDKSTLHIFDLPTSPNSNESKARRRSQSPNLPPDADESHNPAQKWGFLSRIPLLPRVFSDTYSFASTHFELGDDAGPKSPTSTMSYLPALGSLPLRTQKGLLGWISDDTLLCVGTGRDGRWERFRVGERPGTAAVEEGGEHRSVWRDGWKRYLGS